MMRSGMGGGGIGIELSNIATTGAVGLTTMIRLGNLGRGYEIDEFLRSFSLTTVSHPHNFVDIVSFLFSSTRDCEIGPS